MIVFELIQLIELNSFDFREMPLLVDDGFNCCVFNARSKFVRRWQKKGQSCVTSYTTLYSIYSIQYRLQRNGSIAETATVRTSIRQRYRLSRFPSSSDIRPSIHPLCHERNLCNIVYFFFTTNSSELHTLFWETKSTEHHFSSFLQVSRSAATPYPSSHVISNIFSTVIQNDHGRFQSNVLSG
jgi:hypothetical protein